MTTAPSALPFDKSNPMEGIKGFLKLLQGAKTAVPAAQPSAPPEIAAELAYKLAQASARAKDRQMLKDSICVLLDALDGINTALSGDARQ